MATSYLMQAATPDGELVTWLSVAPDFIAASAPALHEGSYSDVTLAGGGLDSVGDTPTNAIVLTSGSRVTLTDGSFVTTS